MDDAEFGSVLLPLSAGAGDDDAAAEEDAPSTRRRTCDAGCGRPASVCVCAHLPASPIPTAATVVVLHHPHELRRNRLATLPSSPAPSSASCPSLGAASAPAPPAPRLPPLPDPLPLPRPPRHRPRAVGRGHAAAGPRVAGARGVRRDVGAGAGDGHGEPPVPGGVRDVGHARGGTAEAVARALRVLEPEGQGAELEAALLKALRAMAGFQASYMKPMKPRPRLTKKMKTKEKEKEMSKRDEEEPGD
uniref:tRNA-uridine aminocarboxypropyltransferase n=1 Tax=Ananas comosus var. bracteatus TaxID=296719 RepID=A0A6V7PFV9_ANACO|nr:unnamed protein product [Ananas comosus var. bracteatus]